MSDVRITIHRSASEIGGNCIEITTEDGARLILDVGRPLDVPEGLEPHLPASLDLSKPVEGVLLSHPHQDHYGLLQQLPASWPVFSGEAAAKLIRLTSENHPRTNYLHDLDMAQRQPIPGRTVSNNTSADRPFRVRCIHDSDRSSREKDSLFRGFSGAWSQEGTG